MTSDAPVLPSLSIEGHLATIALCRPETINAIGPEEIVSIASLLRTAVSDPSVATILLRGEGPRGFCAGGDIKRVRQMIVSGGLDELADFWAVEYRLDHLISTCPKPIVSVAHGLTLGGGMGLASHATHRVVTDSTRMGMPEVLIGLSPDVAGLWLYSRAPGQTGVYAALTAAHLSAGDALYMGLADHYVPDEYIEDLVARLQNVSAAEALANCDGQPSSWVAENRDEIDQLFGAGSVPEILKSAAAPKTSKPSTNTVADAATTALRSGAPTALCVTYEALHRADAMATMAECLEQDLRVGQHCSRHPDLIEGIRARVVDKDRNPKWRPSNLADVSSAEIDQFFEPIGPPLQLDNWEAQDTGSGFIAGRVGD